MPQAAGQHHDGKPTLPQSGAAVTPAAGTADFFAEHSIERSDLPPQVLAAIEALDNAKRTGTPLGRDALDQIQPVLASLGDANDHVAEAVSAKRDQ